MSFYGVEQRFYFGSHRFDVTFDSGSGFGLEQRTIEWREKKRSGKWSSGRILRSFYFDDANDRYMKSFCKKFATDQEYQTACLRSTTDWAMRDSLFERNLDWFPSTLSPFVEAVGGVPAAYAFFKRHWQEIVVLPEYLKFQELDSALQDQQNVPDPEFAEALAVFNTLPEVTTRLSDQGVSGTVHYAGYDILVVSLHTRYAYIRFDRLPPQVETTLMSRIKNSTEIAYTRFDQMLFSRNDNLAFRKAALTLARELQGVFGIAVQQSPNIPILLPPVTISSESGPVEIHSDEGSNAQPKQQAADTATCQKSRTRLAFLEGKRTRLQQTLKRQQPGSARRQKTEDDLRKAESRIAEIESQLRGIEANQARRAAKKNSN